MFEDCVQDTPELYGVFNKKHVVRLCYILKNDLESILFWLEANCKDHFLLGYTTFHGEGYKRRDRGTYYFVSLSSCSTMIKPAIIEFEGERDFILFILTFPTMIRWMRPPD